MICVFCNLHCIAWESDLSLLCRVHVQHHKTRIQPVPPGLLCRVWCRLPRGSTVPFGRFPEITRWSCKEVWQWKPDEVATFWQPLPLLCSNWCQCVCAGMPVTDGYLVTWPGTATCTKWIDSRTWYFWQWLLWSASGRWHAIVSKCCV